MVSPVDSWAPTGVFCCELDVIIWFALLPRLPLPPRPEAAIIYYLDIWRFIEVMERLLALALPVTVEPMAPWLELISVCSLENWYLLVAAFSPLKLCF